MKKNMLTEINNIRRIMGLHLIMEDTKTEIYSLLKQDNVTVGNIPQPETPEEPETPLMESIKRIKTLIFS